MMQLQNPESIILNTKRLVESKKHSEIRLNANGGNSVLIICEPHYELDFINAINKLLNLDSYTVIDLNDVLIQFIKSNEAELEESFELLKGSVQQIFKSPMGETTPDFFGFIMSSIANCYKQKKIPVLINLGSLYGSGIENIHIMENEIIMKSNIPLIVLYPATNDADKLLFLSQRPASKYRCMIIN